MCRPILILGAFAVLFIATAYSQRVRIIRPVYRPPPQRPHYPIRRAREADVGTLRLSSNDELTQLTTEERPLLLAVDIEPNERHVRSLSTPGRGRTSGSSSKGSRGHDTGPTHPGYNRRNAREVSNEPLKDNHFIRWPSTQGPPIIYDDIKMDPSKRYVRSLSTPGRGRASGSGTSRGSRGHDTGPTHPGYNRRNARSLHFPTLPPFNPKPRPWPPSFPFQRKGLASLFTFRDVNV
ncbi:Lebocin-like protein [Operophtera brumata]|uniref:Lebocin-like protein n=1 Tax=Operophtera brumata TaxID=104452 RepID=A0A0L7LSS7_OPEBR|nr:Lebocin-like protein [Operophtera brumata]